MSTALNQDTLEQITRRVDAIPVVPAGDWKSGSAFANVYVGEAGRFRLLTTTRVEVHTTEYEHEVAICYVARTRSNFRLTCMNAPVLIVYGRGPVYFRYMVGYIAHIEPRRIETRYGGDASEQYVVYAAGPTWRMSQPGSQSWENHTTHHIIRDLCQQNFLAADVELADLVWSNALLTLEESQWQFLVRLCKAAGLALAPRGTTVHVRRRDDIRRRDRDRAEHFFDGQITGLKVQVDRSKVPSRHWVRPEVNDQAEPEDTTPPVPEPEDDLLLQICRPEHFVRPQSDATGVPVGAGIAPAGHTNRPGIESPLTQLAPEDDTLVPADQHEAWLAKRRSEAFPVTATCHVPGSAKVHAGGLVRLTPRGTSPWAGVWYVVSCWHVFEGADNTNIGNTDYFLRLTLGDRDLPNDPRPSDPPQRPYTRPGPGDDAPLLVPEGEGGPPGLGRPFRPQPTALTPVLVVTRPPLYRPVPTPADPRPGDPLEPGAVFPDPPPVGLSDALPGPTCPVQHGPFLPAEWRSPYPASVAFDGGTPEEVCVPTARVDVELPPPAIGEKEYGT